jgi:CheY-like chemotaxis protein
MSSQGQLQNNNGENKLRVLLVDDHADMLAMLHMVMQRRSYTIETAGSGRQALEVAEKFSPHVVISDIGMPEMDGCQMMTALKAMASLTPFRSIALTGYGDSAYQDDVRAAGYDVHLTKPIDFEMLFNLIEDLGSDVKPAS